MPRNAVLSLFAAMSLALQGCPPGTPPPVPPMDATGSYTGNWSGTPSGTAEQDVTDCPLSLTLTQNVSAQWPASFAVNGTALIDYSCFNLPEWIETPPPSTVNVGGVMDQQGNLTLLSGGCGTGLCVVLSLAGTCDDTDDDGAADLYDGTWTYTLLLAGVQPFGFTGTYTTDRGE